ncbi:unnamed protein product [Symbiodinium necroappetens]|uniref:PilZ domain-containing protein n=1 Tax=Symbiodinium necroappetens TaxID=1628268 RepID=A0A812Z5U1_9DINO|nr:unnamed protein product [Symbiodinium necroappetens]
MVNRSFTVRGKERRRDRRRRLQLSAEIDGHAVSLVDISIAGFGAAVDATDRAAPKLPLGHRGRLDIWLSDGRRMRLEIEIGREVGPDGMFGGRFLDISDENFRLIEAILLGREHLV